MPMVQIIDDPIKDNLLKNNFRKDYEQVLHNRSDRAYSAIQNYSNLLYPQVQQIEKNISDEIQRLHTLYPEKTHHEIISMVDYESFWYPTDRQAYKTYMENLVWPTSEELIIQEQEKQQLLSLLDI